MRLPSSRTPFSFVREPLPRPPSALYPATPPQMAVSALQRSSSDPHAIVPYSRIQPDQFIRAQSAGAAPSSPLKAHKEQKVQRRRTASASSSTTLRQYSNETLAAAQDLMRDRLRSYRSLLQADADSARHSQSSHGQRQQLQQAEADDDGHCAKERIQQWLRDSGQLHQQAAPTALRSKTSGA